MSTNNYYQPPDWRGLCEELSEFVARLTKHYYEPAELLVRARAALAEPEPEDDVAQLRATLEATAAQRRAEDDARALLAQAEPEVRGPSDEELLRLAREWNSGYENIEFVEFIPEFARAVLARWGRPAPAADDRGVLPMIVSETGSADEPELERIICAAISGGADYVNNMPRALSLERITPEGSTFARYVQVDVGTCVDVCPAPVLAWEVAELVAWLREAAMEASAQGRHEAFAQFHRAADLLERQAAPVPVAVSVEREGAND